MALLSRRFRKKPYQAPRDKTAQSSTLRLINKHITRRELAKGLVEANRALENPTLSARDRARVLALVADSEFKRGRFERAAALQLQAAQPCLGHHRLWLRPLVGNIRALLKDVQVEPAQLMARHAVDLAATKMAEFDAAVRKANEDLHAGIPVTVPPLPPRVSVVASRLGYLFLHEGEPEIARELFEKALLVNPKGACRARQGLARIALALNAPDQALALTESSIRLGRFGAKTLSSWPILIAARRKLAGWRIKERLIAGLKQAPANVRARAVLIIVKELRKNDMNQWREVAEDWLNTEGKSFPVVAAEIRKIELAAWKLVPGHAEQKRRAAETLMQVTGLSPSEWRSTAKEFVRASLWEKRTVNFDALIRQAKQLYGDSYTPGFIHSLALSCMMAKRHDLARELLQRNTGRFSPANPSWSRSVWALARMEELQGNNAKAAELYKRFFDEPSVPLRFRLQAQLLWVKALAAGGDADALRRARPMITEALSSVQDPDLYLNFARQMFVVLPEFEDWSDELFVRGEALALQQFAQAEHPSVAIEILFKLTRRQVYDFGRTKEAIHFWENLPRRKVDWLWSTRSIFWEYLGLVLQAYLHENRPQQAAAFAQDWLQDPATPPDGLVEVGIPHANGLIRRSRTDEALRLFERMTQASPGHPLCAYAWYWKALIEHKKGNKQERDRYIDCLRRAQGGNPTIQGAWQLDAKAHLLMAELSWERVDVQAVNYPAEKLRELARQVQTELLVLP